MTAKEYLERFYINRQKPDYLEFAEAYAAHQSAQMREALQAIEGAYFCGAASSTAIKQKAWLKVRAALSGSGEARPMIPMIQRANGKLMPDLTKMAHKCEWQSEIRLASSGGGEGWIPCAEQKPPDGQLVLLAAHSGVAMGRIVADRYEELDGMTLGDWVTHWRPLPPAPAKEGQ